MWHTSITENSNGIYRLKAIRSTGHEVSMQSADPESLDIFIMAFAVESKISGLRALFEILQSAFGKTQEAIYHEQTFSSWYVRWKSFGVSYNGRECWGKLEQKVRGQWKDMRVMHWHREIKDNDLLLTFEWARKAAQQNDSERTPLRGASDL